MTSPAEPDPASGRSARTEDLVARDLRSLWHPFTQHSVWPSDEPLVVDRAEGMYFWDTDGNRYLDGVSSLWVTVHGHGVPEIDAAVRAQLERLDHTTFLGLSHEPGIELAERLLATAPAGLTRVFYAGDGSSAVEAAIKMAFQAQAQRAAAAGQPLYVHVAEGYHGDTLGAVSVGGIELFHATYRPILLDTRTVSSPGVLARGPGPRRRGPPRCSPRCAARSSATAGQVCAVVDRADGPGCRRDAHARRVVRARGARAVRRVRRADGGRRGGHRASAGPAGCGRWTTPASRPTC